MKLLARPRAVVVPLRQALVFVNAEQDERLLGPGIHEARRGGFGVFQRLHLLVGQFDHGCLLSVVVQPREFRGHHTYLPTLGVPGEFRGHHTYVPTLPAGMAMASATQNMAGPGAERLDDTRLSQHRRPRWQAL